VTVHKPNGPCALSITWPNRKLFEFKSKTRSGAVKAAQEVQSVWTTKSPLAIAFTCRQIYHEAVRIWYGNVRFCFFSLPCMAVFLTEIGASNRKAIRYAGYDPLWGISRSEFPELLRLARTHLVGLRDCIIHWTYRRPGGYTLSDGQRRELDEQWDRSEREAHELLSLGDQLEVVVMSRVGYRLPLFREKSNIEIFGSETRQDYRGSCENKFRSGTRC
jgi:hypothetical protein